MIKYHILKLCKRYLMLVVNVMLVHYSLNLNSCHIMTKFSESVPQGCTCQLVCSIDIELLE